MTAVSIIGNKQEFTLGMQSSNLERVPRHCSFGRKFDVQAARRGGLRALLSFTRPKLTRNQPLAESHLVERKSEKQLKNRSFLCAGFIRAMFWSMVRIILRSTIQSGTLFSLPRSAKNHLNNQRLGALILVAEKQLAAQYAMLRALFSGVAFADQEMLFHMFSALKHRSARAGQWVRASRPTAISARASRGAGGHAPGRPQPHPRGYRIQSFGSLHLRARRRHK